MNVKENVDEEITSRESNDCEGESSLEEITKLIISGEVEASGFGLDSEQKDEVIKGAVKKIKSLKNRIQLLVVAVLVAALGAGSFSYLWYKEKKTNEAIKAVYEGIEEVFGSSEFIDDAESP